jgi:hypothetical protein
MRLAGLERRDGWTQLPSYGFPAAKYRTASLHGITPLWSRSEITAWVERFQTFAVRRSRRRGVADIEARTRGRVEARAGRACAEGSSILVRSPNLARATFDRTTGRTGEWARAPRLKSIQLKIFQRQGITSDANGASPDRP